jgi:hypothetical protein
MPIDDEKLNNIPQASFVRVYLCDDPDCSPHVVLFGKDDQPIAQFIMDDPSGLLEDLADATQYCEKRRHLGHERPTH